MIHNTTMPPHGPDETDSGPSAFRLSAGTVAGGIVVALLGLAGSPLHGLGLGLALGLAITVLLGEGPEEPG